MFLRLASEDLSNLPMVVQSFESEYMILFTLLPHPPHLSFTFYFDNLGPFQFTSVVSEFLEDIDYLGFR